MKIQLTYQRPFKGKFIWLTTISLMLLALWIIALTDQLFAFPSFQNGMARHSLPDGLGRAIAWVIPVTEAAVILLLVFPRTVRFGLLLSTVLLASFVVYIGFGVMSPWVAFECFCSKFINNLSWWGHFWFNAGFLSISATGLILHRNLQRSDRIQDAVAEGGSA